MIAGPSDDEAMVFAPEGDAVAAGPARAGWKVLIVDDDQGIHDVTRLALDGFEFDGRGLDFLDAYSAAQALPLLSDHPDIAVAMVDVVMESEHAGLDLVRSIRGAQGNRLIRLILRTGQPGQAPERAVIRDYDINDYKEKAELSAQKLYSALLTSLRSWRDLTALEANRAGLRRVIDATGRIFQTRALESFVQGVLEQLVALLFLERDALLIKHDSLALEREQGHLTVVAATGQFSSLVGASVHDGLPQDMVRQVSEVLRTREPQRMQDEYWGYFCTHGGKENVIYLRCPRALSSDDTDLIELFLRNVSIAYENNLLYEEINATQRDIVYLLGETIETRSRETGQHVRRVAEYCYLIARGLGLDEHQAQVLRAAAPLHDFGKIGIPDAVLHKPGRLDPDEWALMQTHAALGQELLARSGREILQVAARVAGEHHEKWDGSGYPLGLRGEDISLFGRIAALADVYDALGSSRSYKEPWPLARIVAHVQEERGRHFDPRIADWVLTHISLLQAVRAQYPD